MCNHTPREFSRPSIAHPSLFSQKQFPTDFAQPKRLPTAIGEGTVTKPQRNELAITLSGWSDNVEVTCDRRESDTPTGCCNPCIKKHQQRTIRLLSGATDKIVRAQKQTQVSVRKSDHDFEGRVLPILYPTKR
jgi:hypothetical protein